MKYRATILLVIGGTVEMLATLGNSWRWVGVAMMAMAFALALWSSVSVGRELIRARQGR